MAKGKRAKLVSTDLGFLVGAALIYLSPPLLQSPEISDYPKVLGEVVDRKIEEFRSGQFPRDSTYFECAIYMEKHGRFFRRGSNRDGLCNGLYTLKGRNDVEIWYLPEESGKRILQAKVRGKITLDFKDVYAAQMDREDSFGFYLVVVLSVAGLGLLLGAVYAKPA